MGVRIDSQALIASCVYRKINIASTHILHRGFYNQNLLLNVAKFRRIGVQA